MEITLAMFATGVVAGTVAVRKLGDRPAWRRPPRQGQVGPSLSAGRLELGVYILAGWLGGAIGTSRVKVSHVDEQWRAPAEARTEIEQLATAHAEGAGERCLYDGRVVRLRGLKHELYYAEDGKEQWRLRLETQPTGYFDYLATNCMQGPFRRSTTPHLVDAGRLRTSKLANILAADVTLVTADGFAPIFQRSTAMALAGDCWQTSCGETMEIPADLDADGRPSPFKTAERGLHEELGIGCDELEGVELLGLVTAPETACPGLLMLARTSLTAEVVARRIEGRAGRDHWEHDGWDLLDLTDPEAVLDVLTDPDRVWTRRSAAALAFAHTRLPEGDAFELIKRAMRRDGQIRFAGPQPDLEALRRSAQAVFA